MKNLINANTLTDIQLLSMIIGGNQALNKSEYILTSISIDKLLETQPEELKHVYKLTDSQTQKIENFKSFRKRALIKRDLQQVKSSTDGRDILLPYFVDLVHEEFFCLYFKQGKQDH